MGSLKSHSELPLGTDPDLILAVATPSERIQLSKLNGSAWAGALTPEQYLAREDHLAEQALTRNGQLTAWLLTIANASPDHRPILCACETLQKVGFIARPGCEQVDEVVTHGIASVFCRPEHRGRGYAGRMMHELGKILDEGWQQPSGRKSSFSLLWSDIGPRFYNTHGWKPYPSTHVSLDPISEEVYQATRQRLGLPEPKDLFAHDLEMTICPEDVAQTRSHLLHLANKDSSSATYIAISPDYAHMSWHHAREEFHNSTLQGAVPKVKGCTIPAFFSDTASNSSPRNPFLIWTRRYGSKPSEAVLSGLRLILPYSYNHNSTALTTTEGDDALILAIASLLLRAQREASVWGLHHFELWSPGPLVVAATKMLKTIEDGDDIVISREEESICSLRWNEKNQDEVDHNGPNAVDPKKIEWICNEKYAWC